VVLSVARPVKQAGQGKTSGFQVWLGVHRDELREESPDLSEADLTVLGARRYKGLTSEEKQVSDHNTLTTTAQHTDHSRTPHTDQLTTAEHNPLTTTKHNTHTDHNRTQYTDHNTLTTTH